MTGNSQDVSLRNLKSIRGHIDVVLNFEQRDELDEERVAWSRKQLSQAQNESSRPEYFFGLPKIQMR